MIGEVVGRGEFLSHPHTRANWKRELSVATGLIDRGSYGDWEAAGARSAADRAQAEVERILTKSEGSGLDEERQARITGIMAAEARAHGLDVLP